MDRLEKRVMELFPETEVKYYANDLIANGYRGENHTYRKRVEGTTLMVYYRQMGDTQRYEFGGIIKGCDESNDG